MKLAFVALTLVGATMAHEISLSKPVRIEESVNKLSLCSPCIQLSEQGLNLLLNEILNAGVVGGCGKLCSALKSKGASTVCNLACDIIGIKEFIKILSKTDLDVFYFCELVKMCPVGKD